MKRGSLSSDPYHVGKAARMTRDKKTWDDITAPRGPAHRLPKVRWADVAERLRNGESTAEVAESIQRSQGTMMTELNNRGWTFGGVPQDPRKPSRPDPYSRIRLSEPAPEFMESGSCSSVDPELFFPRHGDVRSRGMTRSAKTVCAGCPVRVPCLQYALDNNEPFGIWGGASPYERRRMKRQAS